MMSKKGKVQIKKRFASRSHSNFSDLYYVPGKMSNNSVKLNVHFQRQLGEQRTTKCSSKYQGSSL